MEEKNMKNGAGNNKIEKFSTEELEQVTGGISKSESGLESSQAKKKTDEQNEVDIGFPIVIGMGSVIDPRR